MGLLKMSISKKYLIKRRHDPPDIRIGKQGIHDNIIIAAKQLLKKRGGAIKVRILGNIAPTKQDVKQVARELAKKISATYIKVIGRTAIIAKINPSNKNQ